MMGGCPPCAAVAVGLVANALFKLLGPELAQLRDPASTAEAQFAFRLRSQESLCRQDDALAGRAAAA